MITVCVFCQIAIEVGENRPIEIDTSSTGRPNAPCRVSVTNPQGKTAELPTKQKPTGYETLFAPLEPGPHLVHVNFNQQEVPKSPFSVKVEPKADVGQVKVMGLETRKFRCICKECKLEAGEDIYTYVCDILAFDQMYSLAEGNFLHQTT